MKKTCTLLLCCGTFAFAHAQMKYIDKANMNTSVKPGDDFYQYANGGWLKTTVMPGTKTRWGSFDMLREKTSQQLKLILEEAAAKKTRTRPEQMSGDFFASGMDSVQLEKLGYTPVKKDLAAVDAVSSINQLLAQQMLLRKDGVTNGFFSAFVTQDAKDINVYRISMGQGGTTLPDRDYYLKNDPRSVAVRNALQSYIVKLFTLSGTNAADAAAYATNILKTETAIAGIQLSRVEMRDPQKRYNKFTPDDFSAKMKTLNIPSLFTSMGIPKQDYIIVSSPGFFYGLDSLLTTLPLDTWKQVLKFDILKNAAPYLSNDFVTANFEYQRAISGQKEMTPRWQRTASLIDGSISEMLGQLYVNRYFKPEARQRMREMVDNLQQTFAARIKRLTWMSDITKEKALNKLMAITKKIAYPDEWKTYDGVTIKRNAFLENVRSANRWAYNYNISKLGQPINRKEFNFSTPTINASYGSTQNTITFPAGILQYPFFDFGADDAVNYGGIMAVIGHEMTHGFDDQGRQSDADGSLRDWWTKEDADKFKVLADAVVKQYDAAVVLDTLHVNGKLTLGENLADFGGLSMAYEAFKNTPQGKGNTLIDGLTPDQRFFLSWAQVWRSMALPETEANLILTDPHSPGRYRAIIPIQQMPEFYKAFDIKAGDKMWLPEEKRVHVW